MPQSRSSVQDEEMEDSCSESSESAPKTPPGKDARQKVACVRHDQKESTASKNSTATSIKGRNEIGRKRKHLEIERAGEEEGVGLIRKRFAFLRVNEEVTPFASAPYSFPGATEKICCFGGEEERIK